MSNLSFKGASNFSITGGNFGDIEGSVLICNIAHFPAQRQFDQPQLSRRADTIPILPTRPQRSKEGLDHSNLRRAVTCPDILPTKEIVDPVSTTRSYAAQPSIAWDSGGQRQPGDPTISEPTPPGCQHTTTVSPQASLQSNNIIPSALLNSTVNLPKFPPETQPQASEGATAPPPVRLPEELPNRVQPRTSGFPDQTTRQSRASHLQALPGTSNVESPQYTQSPPPIVQSPTHHLPHPAAAAMQPNNEDPGTRCPFPRQGNVQNSAPAASLFAGQPEGWTSASISGWSQGVQPGSPPGMRTPQILAPRPQSHCGCIMNSHPSFHPYPAAVSAPGCPQLNYSYSAPWGPLTSQQPYQNHVSHDPYGYTYVHPCVPHGWE